MQPLAAAPWRSEPPRPAAAARAPTALEAKSWSLPELLPTSVGQRARPTGSWGRLGELVLLWLEPHIADRLWRVLCPRRRSPPAPALVFHENRPALASVSGHKPGVGAYEVDAKTGELLLTEASCAAWHPNDAATLCLGGPGGVQVWQRSSVGAWTLVFARPVGANAIVYSPNGLYVAIGGESVLVFESELLEDPRSEPVRLARTWGGQCLALAWSPFTHIPCLAAAYERDVLRLWDVNTWEQSQYTVAWAGPPVLQWSVLTGHLLVCDGRELFELVFPSGTARRRWRLDAEWADAGPPVTVHAVPRAEEGAVTACALCPRTGERLALAVGGRVLVYEVLVSCVSRAGSAALEGVLDLGEPAVAVAFAHTGPSGSTLAVRTATQVRIFALDFTPHETILAHPEALFEGAVIT